MGAPSRPGPRVGRVSQGQPQPTCLELTFGDLALHGGYSLVFSKVGTTKKAISTVLLRNGFGGNGQQDTNVEALAVLGCRRDVWKKRVAQEYGRGED